MPSLADALRALGLLAAASLAAADGFGGVTDPQYPYPTSVPPIVAKLEKDLDFGAQVAAYSVGISGGGVSGPLAQLAGRMQRVAFAARQSLTRHLSDALPFSSA